jgi:hypothetical protein
MAGLSWRRLHLKRHVAIKIIDALIAATLARQTLHPWRALLN